VIHEKYVVFNFRAENIAHANYKFNETNVVVIDTSTHDMERFANIALANWLG